MAGHFYYDDTEITDKIELSKALTGGFAQSFNGGAIGSSGIAINDIAGSLNIVGFHRWKYTEDTATPQRVAGGYIGARKISSGDVYEAPGVARVWDCDLMDLNVLAGLLVCRGATAKRPAESDVERINDYLLSDTGSGFYDSLNSRWLVFDNGGVHTAHPLGHDEDDLRGKYPEEVLQSITWDRRVTCLYWDDAAASGEEPSLWWAPPEDVRGAITQKLSNNPAHINGTTVFAAFQGQAVARDPAGITSGAYLTTKAGTIYRTSAATSAAFISRDRVYQTDLIGRAATAELLAAEMLAFGSAELDVLTCSVEVAAADVNIFREGYSVQAEFTHLPGYSTYQTLTIYNRIIRRPEGMTARYVLDLTLSASAPKSTGGTGGSPGDFPHQPADVAVVQTQGGQDVPGTPTAITLAQQPGVGNILVVWETARGSGWTNTPAGWSTIVASTGFGGDFGRMLYREVTSSDTTSIQILASGTGCDYVIWEISGTDLTPDTFAQNFVTTGTMPGSYNSGTVTPTAGAKAVLLLGQGVHSSDFIGQATFITPGSGFTQDSQLWDDSHPLVYGAHQVVTLTAGSYATAQTLSGFSSNFGGYGGVVVAFIGQAVGDPPLSGQWEPWTVVTMSGATGTTAFPYAASSLAVKVDGLLISRASYTETNPATGAFTLSWSPDTDEVVTVTYQGI